MLTVKNEKFNRLMQYHCIYTPNFITSFNRKTIFDMINSKHDNLFPQETNISFSKKAHKFRGTKLPLMYMNALRNKYAYIYNYDVIKKHNSSINSAIILLFWNPKYISEFLDTGIDNLQLYEELNDVCKYISI
jgi:hypothetical protein